MKKKPIISTYYFPNWHVDPRSEKIHGAGWTEWRVTQYATPRFPGHDQPKLPLWGYEDESNPRVMEKKIKTAVAYGIDNFTFDFYFFEDGPFRERCLNNGFLQAPNTNDMTFSLMWANHNHVYAHPGSYWKPAEPAWMGTVTAETFRSCTDYCMEHYFRKPNYLRLHDGLYFGIYRPQGMIQDMGKEVFAAVLREFRGKVEKAGLGKLWIDFTCGGLAPWDRMETAGQLAKELGADSCSNYGWGHHNTFPTFDYNRWVELNTVTQKEFSAKLGLPYHPVVMTGWDSSPRTVQSDIYEQVGYPFGPIVVGNTPENFKKAFRGLLEFQAEQGGDMIHISCWNEWTEGSYLEPDARYGYGMLEAVKECKAGLPG